MCWHRRAPSRARCMAPCGRSGLHWHAQMRDMDTGSGSPFQTDTVNGVQVGAPAPALCKAAHALQSYDCIQSVGCLAHAGQMIWSRWSAGRKSAHLSYPQCRPGHHPQIQGDPQEDQQSVYKDGAPECRTAHPNTPTCNHPVVHQLDTMSKAEVPTVTH